MRAEEQLQDEFHLQSSGTSGGPGGGGPGGGGGGASEPVYYPTGEFGSGTIGYNSACSALGSKEKLNPGWLPTD